ncbi:hypothetical protein Pelo_6287 [Pelomyxa schiedti]|nr:hypothetical protein Pelo_6287 [Pelomyxa schiedti]
MKGNQPTKAPHIRSIHVPPSSSASPAFTPAPLSPITTTSPLAVCACRSDIPAIKALIQEEEEEEEEEEIEVEEGEHLTEDQQRTVMDTWNTIARVHSGDASLITTLVLNQVNRKLGSTYYDDMHPFLLGLDETSQQNPQSFDQVLQLFALHKMKDTLGGNLDTTNFVQSLPLQTLMRLITALDSCHEESAYAITLAEYKVDVSVNYCILIFTKPITETPQQVARQLVKSKVDLCLGSRSLGLDLLESEAESLHSLFVFMQVLLGSSTPHELTKVLAINKIQAMARGDLEVAVRQFWNLHSNDVDTLVSLIEILLTSHSPDEFVDHLFNAEQDRLCTLIENENSSDKIFLETQVQNLTASEELLKKIIRIKSCSALFPIIKTQDVTQQTLEALTQPFDKVPTMSEVKTYVLETKLTGKIPVSRVNHQLACDHPDIFVYDPPRCCEGLDLILLGIQHAKGIGHWFETYFGEIFHAWWNYYHETAKRTSPTPSITGKNHPDWFFSLDGHVMIRGEEECGVHKVSKPKEEREKTSEDAWFLSSTKYLVTYVSIGQHFQPCVTYREEGKYYTDPLGSPLDLQCEEDKVKIFIFILNVCRLITTFDVFHRIPLRQPIELTNSPNCVVTLTIDGHIQKKISTDCATFSIDTFYSIYEKVRNIVDVNLQPFIIHAVECPNKPPTITKPKQGASSTSKGSSAVADDDFVCPEWVTVTLTPVGDQRCATDELELFVAAVSTLFALAGLHGLGMAHRDVRWANVVFNPQTNAWLLIDLEFAAEFGTPYPRGVVLREEPVDKTCSAKSDVFMLGTMLLKTPFFKDHDPEMFPQVTTWARRLTEKDLNKRPSTEGALQIILENPPPSANKESVLDGRPVFAALLDFDADNGIFRLKRSPLGIRKNAYGDAADVVSNIPDVEEGSEAAEHGIGSTTVGVEEEKDVEADDDEVEEKVVVLSAPGKERQNHTGKEAPSIKRLKKAGSSSSSSPPIHRTTNGNRIYDRNKTARKTKNSPSSPSSSVPSSSYSSSSSSSSSSSKKRKRTRRDCRI